EDVALLAADGGEDVVAPALRADEGRRQRVAGEPADVADLERVRGQLAADGTAVEEERIERDAGEAEAQAVEDGDEADGLDLDAGLLLDLFDDHFGGRVPDVAPAGRIEPDARVGPLDEQQLTLVVADGGADRDLGGDVPRDTLADGGHPLLDQPVGVALVAADLVGLGPDVGRHLQDLLEALLLVEALGETEAGPGNARKALAPSQQRLEGDVPFHVA